MGDRLVHKGYSYNIRLGHERVLHKLERAEISDAVQTSEIESTIGTFTVTIYVKFIVAQAVFLPVIVKLFSVNVEAGQPFVGTQPHTPWTIFQKPVYTIVDEAVFNSVMFMQFYIRSVLV